MSVDTRVRNARECIRNRLKHFYEMHPKTGALVEPTYKPHVGESLDLYLVVAEGQDQMKALVALWDKLVGEPLPAHQTDGPCWNIPFFHREDAQLLVELWFDGDTNE